MIWPGAFLTFVTFCLFSLDYPVAGCVCGALGILFLALDFRRCEKKDLPIFALGILLGVGLFQMRKPYFVTSIVSTQGEATVTSVSRKSVIITHDDRSKLRLTGLSKSNLPPKHARIRYTCEIQNLPDSTFLIFERLTGVRGWCRSLEITTIAPPSGLLAEFRTNLLQFLYRRFDLLPENSLIAAFLLGDLDALVSKDLDAFRDMGLMHLFAVSGLNIALLFGIIYVPFRLLRLPALGNALGYTVATAFLLLLDFPIPLLRAWLFMTIGLGMRVIDRRLPSWTLLFLTAILTELIFPLSSFSMSFILSFGVTAAILLFYQPLHFCLAVKSRVANFLAEHVALTLAAGLPALILGYLLFGTAQPLSLLYNLLLVPFSGLYLFVSLIFLAFEPAKFVLAGLDTLYLSFADWHTREILARFPVADPMSQIASLIFIALLLAALYLLSRHERLWSARRNLRWVVPVTAVVLLVPYLLMSYPSRAIYAVPNKVWMYDEGKIFIAGVQIFADAKPNEPRYCFPVIEKQQISSTPIEYNIVHGNCVIFTGRLKPETWPQTALKDCRSISVFQSKRVKTTVKEWTELFKLFGYSGQVSVRNFFTWYGDKPGSCIKEVF